MILRTNSAAKTEVVIRNIVVADMEEDEFLTFSVGLSTVPAYDGQEFFYYSDLSSKYPKTISRAEVHKA